MRRAVVLAFWGCLTVDQALRLFTIDAAYGTFEEDVKGSLSRGKYADLAILSADPTTAAVDSLPNIQVLASTRSWDRRARWHR